MSAQTRRSEQQDETGLSPISATQPTVFDYSSIPIGYYDEIFREGNPIRRAWHAQKFERVLQYLLDGSPKTILDIGCFAGTFLSMLPQDQFPQQLGVDILPTQIDFAKKKFGTAFRDFKLVGDITDIPSIAGQFDCVTLIEVIEHLYPEQIRNIMDAVSAKLKPGGRFIMSTPNYTSAWPLIEILLNMMSDVKYEEQHVTKFNYFTCIQKLEKIWPRLHQEFELEVKTTSHFIAPFLAGLSYDFAQYSARAVHHKSWKFPFGNLIFLSFRKR